MTPSLRPYQHRSIAELRPVLRERPLLVIPTGGGKTHVACEMIRRVTERGYRTLFVAHRAELIDQAVARLAQFGLDAGVIMANRPRRESLIQVGTVQTLARRDLPPADFVVVDEAHHVAEGAKQYLRVLKHYPQAWTVGLTATPFRLDGKGLGFVFGAIVAPVTVRDLIDAGAILEPEVFAPGGAPDLRGVKSRGGDFSQDDLDERFNKRELVGSIVEHWQTLAAGRRTIVFAVSLAHSRLIVERFREAGIAAEHVEAGSEDRAAIFARLARGETLIVSNVGIATEGWDLPELEVCVLARPTKSLALHLQMVGRIMRAIPGKSCRVLDHAGNHHRLGLVTDPIEYSLSDRVRSMVNPVRTCGDCGAVFRGVACPHCGITDRAEGSAPLPLPDEVAGALVRFTREDRAALYREMVIAASSASKSIASARAAYRKRFGAKPDFRSIEREAYRCKGHYFLPGRFGRFCAWCHVAEAAA